ncbi:hypothetical protein, partial [Aeromonas caviae]|uniref:hypothetical protein n=1 Tax=Aeromonas caviae TaxID=648 RepID=UPI001FC7C885
LFSENQGGLPRKAAMNLFFMGADPPSTPFLVDPGSWRGCLSTHHQAIFLPLRPPFAACRAFLSFGFI